MSDRSNFVAEITARAAERDWLSNPAYRTDEHSYSYAEVLRLAAETATALRHSGIGPGDRVCIVLPETIDLIAVFLAALRIGAVAVPINGNADPELLTDAVRRSGAKLVVRHREFTVPDGCIALWPDQLRGAAADPDIAVVTAETPAFAVFTSGTTGPAKLVVHTHGDIRHFDEGVGNALGIAAGEVCLSASGTYLAYGLGNAVFFPLLRGASTVLNGTDSRLVPAEALRLIEQHAVDVFYAIPSYFTSLLREPGVDSLKRLRLAVTAGEVLNKSVEEALITLLGSSLTGIFGTTEIGHAVAVNAGADYRRQKVGRVIGPYAVRIVDRVTGEPIPTGRIGSLEVHGPTITLGAKEATAAPVRLAGQWYATGDVALLDEDGYLQLFGRADDVETVAGQDVYPAEVESVLLESPAVREAAVCTVTGPDGERRLRAYVVRNDTAVSELELERRLLAAAAKALAPHKVPREVRYLDALPYILGGKLSRRDVRLLG
ncbi:AMP-binding protein [Nocardia sp. CDC159]|uniref:AMP-binding protein n=1 Tax=Nocardia pulmonis TaxID=2951408 RepID=A0A9X2EI30_9NOCA|nr:MULTISPECIES: AMP-binding protein [Nocardia]MCM6779058.1 AMP-binding protein [Nocardia pulmonis]MCM6791948.1 AMP-binding protein [Nocardia sp. CDC159]